MIVEMTTAGTVRTFSAYADSTTVEQAIRGVDKVVISAEPPTDYELETPELRARLDRACRPIEPSEVLGTYDIDARLAELGDDDE